MISLAMLGGVFGLSFAIIFIVVGLKYCLNSKNGLQSSSHLQIILWMGVIAGSYIALAILKQGFLDINYNLLGLMGISAGSTVGAATIRRIQKPVPKPFEGREQVLLGGLFTNWGGDKKQLSIEKLQMFTWTLISITIYVWVVIVNLANNQPQLPDIGLGLTILMGISHSAYLGNKITDKSS